MAQAIVGREAPGIFAGDSAAGFYNLDGFSTFAMTADIDWAPDYAIADLYGLFADAGLKLTAFATHASEELRRPPSFVEIGLHPDFTRMPEGTTPADKFRRLRDIYPDAVGTRSHRNVFGQNIAHAAAGSGLVYDASVFHWRLPYCQAQRDQWGLVRMSYCWEDGIQADMRLGWDMEHVPIEGPGLKIFNVHPAFIYLNCPDDDYRRAIVKDFPDLTQAPRSVLEPARYAGYGARSFLIDLLKQLRNSGARSLHLHEIAAAVR
jgi:hypothetical protein